MKKKICKLNLTAIDKGESVAVEGRVHFNGTGDDLASVFASLFDMFELEDTEAMNLCFLALQKREEDAHGDE